MRCQSLPLLPSLKLSTEGHCVVANQLIVRDHAFEALKDGGDISEAAEPT